MEKDYKEKCFAELEKEVRIKLPNIPSVQDWYEEMRYRKLSEFDASDLARAIRHKIFLEFTVPAALEKMAMESVIVGSYYGELMFELLNIPRRFWEQHEEFADNLRVMIEEFLDRVEELTMVAKAIIGRLSRVYPWMAQRSEKSKESLFYTISHELLFYKKEQAESVVDEIQKKGYEVWLEKADRGYKVIVTKHLPIDKKFCDIINEFDNELEELSERFSGNLE
ncbi:MAG: contact-dependent growth inhibition system immunity protein [Deltaproteobacteria bacterium]|nr:contact-dependent growth inhibition system immunity protein [Deltaproteobacteria bacterium]